MVVLELHRPVGVEAVFDAAANHPAEPCLGRCRGENADRIEDVLLVRHGAARLQVDQPAIPRMADAAGREADRLDARAELSGTGRALRSERRTWAGSERRAPWGQAGNAAAADAAKAAK